LPRLAQAAELVGPELFPDGVPDDSTPPDIDAVAVERLGELYGVAAEALNWFKESLPADAEPGSTNLWPEHFDIAFDAGVEAAAQRAGYGVWPGDQDHDQRCRSAHRAVRLAPEGADRPLDG
jgi:hypothetical protein